MMTRFSAVLFLDMSRVFLSFVLICTCSVFQTEALAQPLDTIRKAAIERLEKKLGTMRGSIDRKKEMIFVTRIMVERFKPLDGTETFAQRLERLKREENPPPYEILTGKRDIVLDGVSMAEIYAIAGIEDIAGHGKAHNKTDGLGLESADLDEIIAGVDAMISEQNRRTLEIVAGDEMKEQQDEVETVEIVVEPNTENENLPLN